MSTREDPRILEAKAIPVEGLIERLQITGLRRVSREWVGPCPLCGGRDRFAIQIATSLFNCRNGDLAGGDQIALVMQVLKIPFLEALTWLCGDMDADISESERARRREVAARDKAKSDKIAKRKRDIAIQDARNIWGRSRAGHLGVVPTYLRARGIDPDALGAIPEDLHWLRDHPYVKYMGGRFETLHRC